MSASRVHRPTENAAIGRVGHPPRLDPQQLLLDRAAAVTRGDRHGYHLLGGRLQRALGVKAAG